MTIGSNIINNKFVATKAWDQRRDCLVLCTGVGACLGHSQVESIERSSLPLILYLVNT